MKWYLLIGSIVVIVVTIGIFLLVPNTPSTAELTQGGSLPNANSITNVTNNVPTTTSNQDDEASMVVGSQVSPEGVVTKDFLHNGSAVQDAQNPGQYFVTNHSSDEYRIVYQSKDGVFIIALLAEPLYQARQHAEQLLSSTLGISEAEMCTLKYYLSTDAYTNAVYAGKNLLFSFCLGATTLPQ